MNRTTTWDLDYRKQMSDPEMRALVEQELEAPRSRRVVVARRAGAFDCVQGRS
jgi:hypothetical protein